VVYGRNSIREARANLAADEIERILDLAFGMLTDDQIALLLANICTLSPTEAKMLILARPFPPEAERTGIMLQGMIPPNASFARDGGELAVLGLVGGAGTGEGGTIPTDEATRIIREIVPEPRQQEALSVLQRAARTTAGRATIRGLTAAIRVGGPLAVRAALRRAGVREPMLTIISHAVAETLGSQAEQRSRDLLGDPPDEERPELPEDSDDPPLPLPPHPDTE
jgi:hypothetical protein